MKFEGNLSTRDVIIRHFLGMFLIIVGGFLGHYVSPIFYALIGIGPLLIFTAILAWCPIFEMMGINHVPHSDH